MRKAVGSVRSVEEVDCCRAAVVADEVGFDEVGILDMEYQCMCRVRVGCCN
jgi:hypothetical protein